MLKAAVSSFLLCGVLWPQSPPAASTQDGSKGSSSRVVATSSSPSVSSNRHSRYQPARFAARAGEYYRLLWGIDSLSVKWAESGEVIRFTYRILDADKAKTLSDKKLEPSLIDNQAHVKLVVPMMDKVGKLRQTNAPESGKTYWMLFSNKGGYVKRGDRVDVVIGNFRADGLVVD